MKKLALIIPVLVLLILTGCEKIKLNRLTGYWTLKSWKLTDVNDSTFNGLTLYPEKDGEEIFVEFKDDGRVLLLVFAGDTIKYADNGLWEQEDHFETITFADPLFFFNKNVPYEFVELSNNKLELKGYFKTATDSFPNSRLKFEEAD